MWPKIRPFLILILIGISCRVLTPTDIPQTEQPTSSPVQESPVPPMTIEPTVVIQLDEEIDGSPLQPFVVDTASPFGYSELIDWEVDGFNFDDLYLPIDMNRISNPQVVNGLTTEQLEFLSMNGFVAIHSQENQFHDIRIQVARNFGQPYFLTVDAAFHALHIEFDDLLKQLERDYLRLEMILITQSILDEVLTYVDTFAGTSVEKEAVDAVAYLSVALKLFDPQAQIDPLVETTVAQQVDQIMAAAGRDYSVLFPDFEDDYGAYKPVGHYFGDPDLEAYFRGMTWFGRVHFRLSDEDPNRIPSRLPLIVTLAMRRAAVADQTAAECWTTIHELLTYLIGPSDDGGPPEYAALMDEIYGSSPSPSSLADDALWEEFKDRKDEIPTPRINSTFVDWVSTDMEEERGWRFMGQRFTLDAFIFQNMIFDMVDPLGDQRRLFPSGLDVAAAFGSDLALDTLDEMGETIYPNYYDQMDLMREAVQAQPQEEWLNRFYNSWLYSFFPVVTTSSDLFPPFMRTDAWGYKNINAILGSWAELKHDTILYSKMPEGAGGGGPPSSGPAPGYVEPNPEAFYRMAYMAESLETGLSMLIPDTTYELRDRISGFGWLGGKLRELGDIAVKELSGQPLSQDDFYTIQDCLGRTECWSIKPYDTGVEMPPAPVIAAVSGAEQSVLEAAVGYIDRIFVVVQLEGTLQIAQGGIFSYYEFLQPRSNRLTDQEWREMLESDNPPLLPPWASNFLLEGGSTTDWLAFRVGDVLIVNQEGDGLNLRASPSTSGEILEQVEQGEYLEIIGGPTEADGWIWWQVQTWTQPEGWIVEHQDWYERAWGQ